MLVYLFRFLFPFYLFITGTFLEETLVVIFKIERTWRSKFLGAFFSLWLLGSLAGAGIVFFRFSYGLLAVIFAVHLIISFCLNLWGLRLKFPEPPKNEEIRNEQSWKRPLILVYLGLVAYGFYLLLNSKTGEGVTTPWAVIDKNFIYIFALSTFLLGYLLLSKLKIHWLLPLLMVHSFLLLSYLPLTHDLIYGGDGWRHLAVEERVASGDPILKPEITDEKPLWDLSFIIGKLSYSQLWGITILLAKVLGLSFLFVNKWLMVVVWALFVPIILFEIGKSFGWSDRLSLFFVWLGFLPFTWQAAGAFTLPSNLGFVVWLAMLLLILKRAEHSEPEQMYFLIGMGILLIFGYSLFTLLFWMSFLVLEWIRWEQDFTWFRAVQLILGIGLVLPLAEWIFGYSGITPLGNYFEEFKQLIGNFSAFYLASGPRPHDILTGNVIFNQAPVYSFVYNIFVSFRWWLVAFMVAFWVLVFSGIYVSWKKGFGTLPDFSDTTNHNRRIHFCWLIALFFGLFLSYIVSRYMLPGEHLLTRRLDVVLAFLLLTIFVIGVSQIPAARRPHYLVLLAFLLGSLAISASYSLGPDTNSTSVEEYSAMNYVWKEESNKDNHCVIADTYPLLTLEALSKKKIIGGGFPISHDFGQMELSEILNRSNGDVSILDVRKALDITRADSCWIVVPPGGQISYFIKKSATSTKFGDLQLWKYTN